MVSHGRGIPRSCNAWKLTYYLSKQRSLLIIGFIVITFFVVSILNYSRLQLLPWMVTVDPNYWNWSILPTHDDSQSSNFQQPKRFEQSTDGRRRAYLPGRSIVMCTGDDMYMVAGLKYALYTIRTTFKSNVPISIAHCAELSSSLQVELTSTYSDVSVINICEAPVSAAQKRRLRGWFCKPAALVRSPYEETMVVDIDTVWFENPALLFDLPAYKDTGALFFRDRLLFEKPGCGLNHSLIESIIEDGWEVQGFGHLRLAIANNFTLAKSLTDSTLLTPRRQPDTYSHSYYWRYALPAHGTSSDIEGSLAQYRPLCHVQESSVVLMNKVKMPRTVELLRQMIPSFAQGYGDKEIYWIAATIAREAFAWEPFIAGAYGDCGEILHFDPRDPEDTNALPYFMNGQYLTADIHAVGKGLSGAITRPVPARASAGDFELGAFKQSTSGRCGACALMGGCQPTPRRVNDALLRLQRFQLEHAKPLSGMRKWMYYFLRRIKRYFS